MPTHFRGSGRDERFRERADHSEEEEEEVGDHDSAESAEHTEECGHSPSDDHSSEWRDPEHDPRDLDRSEGDRRHDHDIEEDTEVESTKGTEEGSATS